MSFGWSISDAAKLAELGWRIVQNTRKACGEHDEITREVFSLHVVLRRLEREVEKPESTLNRPGDTCREDLGVIASGCQKVLNVLDRILEKYNALSEEEKSVRKLWQRVKFGNGEIATLKDLREKTTYYTSALSLYLNMVSVGSIGKVEKQMEEAGGDLKEVKRAVNSLTAHLMVNSAREGSVLTSYTNDDKTIWRGFRRDLVKRGFSSSFLHKHKHTIKAYFEELGSRGVLDEPEQTDISNILITPSKSSAIHKQGPRDELSIPETDEGYRTISVQRSNSEPNKLADRFGWSVAEGKKKVEKAKKINDNSLPCTDEGEGDWDRFAATSKNIEKETTKKGDTGTNKIGGTDIFDEISLNADAPMLDLKFSDDSRKDFNIGASESNMGNTGGGWNYNSEPGNVHNIDESERRSVPRRSTMKNLLSGSNTQTRNRMVPKLPAETDSESDLQEPDKTDQQPNSSSKIEQDFDSGSSDLQEPDLDNPKQISSKILAFRLTRILPVWNWMTTDPVAETLRWHALTEADNYRLIDRNSTMRRLWSQERHFQPQTPPPRKPRETSGHLYIASAWGICRLDSSVSIRTFLSQFEYRAQTICKFILEILRRQLPYLRQMITAIDLITEAIHKSLYLNKFSEHKLRDFLKLGESIWYILSAILERFLYNPPKGERTPERVMKELTEMIKFWNSGFETEIWISLLSIYPFHRDSFQRFQEDLRVDAIIDMVSRVVKGSRPFAESTQSPYVTHLWKDLEQIRALLVRTKFPKKLKPFYFPNKKCALA